MRPTQEITIYVSSVPLECRPEARGVAAKVEAQYRAFRRRYRGTILVRPRCTLNLGRAVETLVRGLIAALWLPRGAVYVRYDSYTALLILALGLLGRVTVAEVNGRLSAEVSGWKRWLQAFCDRLCLPYATQIVAVAEDVRSYVLEATAGARRKPMVAVIGNAIEVPPHHIPRVPDGNPTLFYLGTFRRAHGLDLLLDALSTKTLYGVRLLLAGAGPEESTIRQQVKALGLEKQVRFLGWVDEDELTETLTTVDLGIGPLAGERVGLRTAAALKVRSYLAHGVPCIVGYEEDPETMKQPFIFRVSGDREDLARQIADALTVCQSRGDELRLEAWRYARDHFSYDAWVLHISRLLECDPPVQVAL